MSFHIENANKTRQWLQHAKSLSDQCGTAIGSAEGQADTGSSACSDLLSDVYSAGSDDEGTDVSEMGRAALAHLRGLSGVEESSLESVSKAEGHRNELHQALSAAWSLAGQLGVPDVKAWFVRNPVSSARDESDRVGGKLTETRRALGQVDNAMGTAGRYASDVADDREGENVSFSGQKLYDSSDDIQDGFSEAARAANWAQSHRGSIDSAIDRALGALDALERESAVGVSETSEVAPPTTQTTSEFSPAQPANAPLPMPIALSPTPAAPAKSGAQGFFLSPWRG